jgi:hypothetical protein
LTDANTDHEYVNELNAARAEFEHRLRQLNDIAERNGVAYGPVGEELKQVRQNLKEIVEALEKVIKE